MALEVTWSSASKMTHRGSDLEVDGVRAGAHQGLPAPLFVGEMVPDPLLPCPGLVPNAGSTFSSPGGVLPPARPPWNDSDAR